MPIPQDDARQDNEVVFIHFGDGESHPNFDSGKDVAKEKEYSEYVKTNKYKWHYQIMPSYPRVTDIDVARHAINLKFLALGGFAYSANMFIDKVNHDYKWRKINTDSCSNQQLYKLIKGLKIRPDKNETPFHDYCRGRIGEIDEKYLGTLKQIMIFVNDEKSEELNELISSKCHGQEQNACADTLKRQINAMEFICDEYEHGHDSSEKNKNMEEKEQLRENIVDMVGQSMTNLFSEFIDGGISATGLNGTENTHGADAWYNLMAPVIGLGCDRGTQWVDGVIDGKLWKNKTPTTLDSFAKILADIFSFPNVCCNVANAFKNKPEDFRREMVQNMEKEVQDFDISFSLLERISRCSNPDLERFSTRIDAFIQDLSDSYNYGSENLKQIRKFRKGRINIRVEDLRNFCNLDQDYTHLGNVPEIYSTIMPDLYFKNLLLPLYLLKEKQISITMS